MVPKSPPGATYPPERPIARNSERQECGSTSRRCPDAADSGSTGSGHRRTGDRLRSACRQSPGDVSNDAVPPMTRGHASPNGVHRQRNQRPEGQRGDEPCQREAEAPAKSLLKVVPEPGKGTGSLRARRSPAKAAPHPGQYRSSVDTRHPHSPQTMSLPTSAPGCSALVLEFWLIFPPVRLTGLSYAAAQCSERTSACSRTVIVALACLSGG